MVDPFERVLTIRTPEGVAFSFRLASPVERLFAWVVDLVLMIAALMMLGMVLGALGVVSGEVAMSLNVLCGFAIWFGYAIVLEYGWNGQTLGKWTLGLRVMDDHGLRLQLGQVVVRNLLRAVDFLPAAYLVGGTACVLGERAQRLGDLAAGTVVARIPRRRVPNLASVAPGKFNSLREHGHLVARLRQVVTPQEASLALAAVVRREQLEGPARVALFAEFAAHFRALASFPPEAVEGLSDEQYVRNVVDVLYRERVEVTAS